MLVAIVELPGGLLNAAGVLEAKGALPVPLLETVNLTELSGSCLSAATKSAVTVRVVAVVVPVCESFLAVEFNKTASLN